MYSIVVFHSFIFKSIENWFQKLGENTVAETMEQAFALWAKHSGLRFERSFDPNADIIVKFCSFKHGDSYPFDGPGAVLAHAFHPNRGLSFDGDIHFDDDENWNQGITLHHV